MKASEIITEKKLKKADYSEEEWALIKAARQARHVMGEILARTISKGIKIMKKRGYEFNYQYASSMAKRMAPGMLLLVNDNNKDKEKLHKQITPLVPLESISFESFRIFFKPFVLVVLACGQTR